MRTLLLLLTVSLVGCGLLPPPPNNGTKPVDPVQPVQPTLPKDDAYGTMAGVANAMRTASDEDAKTAAEIFYGMAIFCDQMKAPEMHSPAQLIAQINQTLTHTTLSQATYPGLFQVLQQSAAKYGLSGEVALDDSAKQRAATMFRYIGDGCVASRQK
jgi:hypothetical protein